MGPLAARIFFYMQCRAKKIVDANPDLYPVTPLSPKRRYTSRKLNMTPSERKRLADGVRAARRRIRATSLAKKLADPDWKFLRVDK
jgi:hypothetical protein